MIQKSEKSKTIDCDLYQHLLTGIDIVRDVSGSEITKNEAESLHLCCNTRHGERQRLQSSLKAEVEYLRSFNKQLKQERDDLNDYIYELSVMVYDFKHTNQYSLSY